MKHILSIFLLIIFIAFIFDREGPIKNTEVTISIPDLNSNELALHLKNEINKYQNIDYIEGSLLTKTLVIRVSESTFNKSDIDKLLYKWGCNASEYYYRKLYSLENN